MDTNLVIKNVSRTHKGTYTCRVITKTDQQASSTYLTVLFAAKLIDPEFEGKFYETLR